MSEKQQRYSGSAMVLHWAIALALAAEIALGFAMPKDASGFELYQLHKSIGITILALTFLRLWLRVREDRPPPAGSGITGKFASAVHLLFYAFMVLMPLTGWVIVSTASIEVPTLLWGVVPIPHLPLPESLNGLAEETHEVLAFGGIGLFVLHVVGALRHQFLLRDRLLARMSPGGPGSFALIMAGVVVTLGLLVFVRSGNVEPAPVTEGQDVPEASGLLEPAEGTADPDSDAVPAEGEADVEEVAPAGPEAAPDEAAEAPAPPATAAASVPPPAWSIEPGGALRFAVDNAGTAISGSFSRWDGAIVMDPANPSTARIRIEVDLSSATLGDATQDRMLRGEDFLATSANPTAIWRALGVRALGGGRYEADGTLSLKGVSRPQRIRFTLTGEGDRRAVQGSASIDRTAFSVGTGENAANLAPNVRVSFAFDATR